ncbi:MAG: hypothetical protein P8Q92_11555 [Pseudoprimorskyibacter sp.]|nr:hypothetical protein [Pseudoprimorskyibacter sp.]
MTLIKIEERASALEDECQKIAQMLADMVEDLEELRKRARTGEATKKDGNAVLSELRYWLRAARETEKELDQINRQNSGVAGDYGLDLDIARVEIGCRLARIRTCCDAGRLPG